MKLFLMQMTICWKKLKEFVTRLNDHLQTLFNHNYNSDISEHIGNRHYFGSIENITEIL
jgi:hypothetical protein